MKTGLSAGYTPRRIKHLATLNSQQKDAVQTMEGPVLVLAGAGTGKTRVITTRIAYLLAQGVRPENILAVTFTNKAAREMRDRVGKMVGKETANAIILSTFHSFCARVLRSNADAIGIRKNFTLCDSADQSSLMKSVLRELRVPEKQVQPSAAIARISLWKNQLLTPEKALDAASDPWEEYVARAFRRYEEQLRRNRVLDFDDLLLFALRLFQENETVRKKYAKHFQWIMVDEYQDTNGPQYGILHALAKDHRNLCVVGDDDQSIYGWRGADVSKILGFEKDYPGAKVVRLETNYRSTPEILNVANALIQQNIQRHDKELKPALESGVPVMWLPLFDEMNEASYVVGDIRQSHSLGETRWKDYAILFRTQTQPRAFEAELRRLNIPYKISGTRSFFDRKEVRDLLAFMKLMENPDDEVSLLRILNVPPRGIGKTSVDKMLEKATEEGVALGRLLLEQTALTGLPEKPVKASTELLEELVALKKRGGSAGDLVGMIRGLIDLVDYRREVERCYDDPTTLDIRWNGVAEVVNFAENHARTTPKASLNTFLEALALDADDQEEEDEDERDAVTLMTLHAAKGLEFPRVYLVGFEEGLLPHARSAAEGNVEEERRLAYVGYTRAQRMLTVTWAEQRTKWGRQTKCHASRFYYETTAEPLPDGWMASGQEPPPRPAHKKKTKTRKRRATSSRASSRKRRS